MKWLFESADAYLKKCDWKDMALLKFCLFAMGILAGIAVPEKSKKSVKNWAVVVFVITYIPLMAKYIGVIRDKWNSKGSIRINKE